MHSTTGNPKLSALLVLYDQDHRERDGINWIIEALDEHDGKVEDAADELSVTRQTLYKWIKKYQALKVARDKIIHDASERRKGLPREEEES